MKKTICPDPLYLVRPLIQKIFSLLWSKSLKNKSGKADYYQHHSLELIVLPEVFHPYYFITGQVFADFLLKHMKNRLYERVLDMGTGSGVVGITMSQFAKHVDCIDINPNAVRCAQINARYHRIQGRMKVYEGDLFSPLKPENGLYDLILFNPPFYKGQPGHPLEHALYGGKHLDVITRFAVSAPSFLKDNGKIILLLSTSGALEEILKIMDTSGYSLENIDWKDCYIERLFLLECHLQ